MDETGQETGQWVKWVNIV